MFDVKEREADLARAQFVTGLVAYGLETPLEEVQAGGRGSRDASFARQVAMYVSHVAFEMSLARVAAAFGRDRSTVSHACHVVEDRRDEAGFDVFLEKMEAAARAMPEPIQVVSGEAA